MTLVARTEPGINQNRLKEYFLNGLDEELQLAVSMTAPTTAREALDKARIAEAAGADGITAHLREDRRHITDADIDAFIDETYARFFVRLPTEAERTYVRNFIQGNPYMTPELVYFSFALSDEYMYY